MSRSGFGSGQAQTWARLCPKIGGRVVSGKWKGDKVQARVDDWLVTLDTVRQSNGYRDTSYTQLRAPFLNPDRFRFNLYRAGIGTGLAKFCGIQDLEVGAPLFDAAFVVQANSEPKVRELFAVDRIREVLLAQPWGGVFSIQEQEGRLESSGYPDGVELLHYQANEVVSDVDRLKSLFELFAEVLNRLRQLDMRDLSDLDLSLRALEAPGGQITSDHLVIWDGDPPRAAAAQRLGALRATAALQQLQAALAAPDLHLRANAAWALGEIGDSEAKWALIPLLGDVLPSYMPQVNFYAATALRQLGCGELVDALTAVLQGHDSAIGTLLRHEGPELTEALDRLLNSPNSLSVAQSAWALGEFDAVDLLPRLRERLRALRRTAASSHLERIAAAIEQLETRARLPRPAAAPAADAQNLPRPSGELAP